MPPPSSSVNCHRFRGRLHMMVVMVLMLVMLPMMAVVVMPMVSVVMVQFVTPVIINVYRHWGCDTFDTAIFCLTRGRRAVKR